MYKKDLSKEVRLRISENDMNFLIEVSEARNVTVSECIRSIIGEYRRATETMDTITKAMKLVEEQKRGLSNGDTKTDINDKL